jgi:hypothetical protein
MKKAGLFLRLGMVAMITAALSTVSFAQQAAKKPGQKNAVTRVASPVIKPQVINHGQKVSATKSVVKPTLNPRLASQKRAAVGATSQGSGARNCTPRSAMKPNSITRANFNKLPKDRQAFVMQHSDKYTIVD